MCECVDNGCPRRHLTAEGFQRSKVALWDARRRTLTVQKVEGFFVDEVPFVAPPAGSYTLRVHVLSTSVVGVELTTDVTFTVEEDDVPALQ